MVGGLLYRVRGWLQRQSLRRDHILKSLDQQIADRRRRHRPVRPLLIAKQQRLHELLRTGAKQ